ncbi:MAG TPA: hypothetical protein P5081_17945 [Phycisphaerae bacterium]|nr:hypothetical protein [Phycisphaerae bacterium]HRW54755.1 hypothetical protein [Phycisphaerae bacterium]
MTSRISLTLSLFILGGIGCTTLSELTSLLGQLSGSTTDASASDVPSDIGAAIAAIFSGGQEGGAPLSVPAGAVSPDVGSTCRDFEDDSESNGPDGITVSAMITAGVYGASGASVTLTGDDDCESDNTSDDSFASFEIMENIVATCENGSTVTLLPGGTGVYRNNETEGHFPEIYGTFNIADGDSNTFEGVVCTIFLDEDQNVVEATCEDSDGNEIDVDTGDTTCQFQTN